MGAVVKNQSNMKVLFASILLLSIIGFGNPFPANIKQHVSRLKEEISDLEIKNEELEDQVKNLQQELDKARQCEQGSRYSRDLRRPRDYQGILNILNRSHQLA